MGKVENGPSLAIGGLLLVIKVLVPLIKQPQRKKIEFAARSICIKALDLPVVISYLFQESHIFHSTIHIAKRREVLYL